MINKIDFYFDFISPYAYLAHKKIKIIKENEKININYKPILLGGLHNIIGITAPAFINPKAKFMVKDCKMVAKKFNIKFKFNPLFPINSLNLMRGLLSINLKFKNIYIDTFFDAYWKDAINLNDKRILNNLLKRIKINKNDFYKKINDKKIKNRLKNLTQSAFNKNIFGAPTFVVNNKIFWGQDRLEYAVDEYNKVKLL